jgi:hypothetical protein
MHRVHELFYDEFMETSSLDESSDDDHIIVVMALLTFKEHNASLVPRYNTDALGD